MDLKELKSDIKKIYIRYYKSLYMYCLKMCGNNHDTADEITQNTFYKAICKAESFRGDSQVFTWLCQIARNDYINFLRKERRFFKDIDFETMLEEIPHSDESADKKAEDSDTALQIKKIAADLEHPYSEVFFMKTVNECEYKDIAAAFNKTENWARVTYYRAKEKIIKKLGRGV